MVWFEWKYYFCKLSNNKYLLKMLPTSLAHLCEPWLMECIYKLANNNLLIKSHLNYLNMIKIWYVQFSEQYMSSENATQMGWPKWIYPLLRFSNKYLLLLMIQR